mmetsp:Transcript_106291/g.333299  ORF Transcript_106291/g.333299 Transcript_106291/m.333299 type:complete len:147 (+) Transcript_106291:142-582(+)
MLTRPRVRGVAELDARASGPPRKEATLLQRDPGDLARLLQREVARDPAVLLQPRRADRDPARCLPREECRPRGAAGCIPLPRAAVLPGASGRSVAAWPSRITRSARSQSRSTSSEHASTSKWLCGGCPLAELLPALADGRLWLGGP